MTRHAPERLPRLLALGVAALTGLLFADAAERVMPGLSVSRFGDAALNRIPIVVTEPDTTVTEKFAEITVAAAEAQVRVYDLNGNLTGIATAAAPGDMIRTFEWDAADRLIAINQYDPPGGTTPAKRSEFGYNERSERVEAKEYEAGVLVSHQRFLWSGSRLHQVRDATGDEVLVTYTGSGEADYAAGSGGVPVKRHYLTDHLGSVRNVIDAAGAELVSYDYDPYGVREKIFASSGAGSYEAAPGYTGHWHHAASGLVLTHYRGYEPETGRWLSPDPLGEAGGLNLYGYVGGDPVNQLDPDGLSPVHTILIGAVIGAAEGIAVGVTGESLGTAMHNLAYENAMADAVGQGGYDAVFGPNGNPLFGSAYKVCFEYGLEDAARDGAIGGALGAVGAGVGPMIRALKNAKYAARSGGMFSHVGTGPRASSELVEAVGSKGGRSVTIAREGSEELRYLDAMGAEANVGGPGHLHIILRENPSKAAVLEEFLHGTQDKLGIIDRLGVDGAEAHVADFMRRHARLLGLE